MRPAERLATMGAFVSLGSLFLPWYRVPGLPDETKTGIQSFGFAIAALVITLLAGLYLLLAASRRERPKLPLGEGILMALCGLWTMAIVGYLCFDRPDFNPDSVFGGAYRLSYGIGIALAGATLMVVGGLRVRRLERRLASAFSES